MLFKSTIREIKSSLGRYLAIFAIIALGVGFFCGLKMCRPDMIDTASEYLEEHNLYDYEILSSYGIDDDSVELALKTDGVADAEASMQKDILIKGEVDGKTIESVFKAISIPERINTLNLVEGRLPKNNKECVIDNFTVVGASYQVGQTIILSENNTKGDIDAFKSKKYTIVGTVSSPLYLDYQRGTTTLGNGTIDNILYINRSAFDTDYSTQMYVKLDGKDKPFTESMATKLNNSEDSMKKLAEKMTRARRKTAQKQARDILREKQEEYDEGVAKFNSEEAAANWEIAKARDEINDGKSIIKKNEKELKEKLKELQSAKQQIQDGIAEVNELQAAIDGQYAAGLIEEEEYKAYTQDINSKLKELNSNMKDVNNGIKQVNNGLEQLKDKKTDINDGEKELNKKSAVAKTELEKARTELTKAKAALEDAESQIDEMETGNSYALTRDDNAGYSTFESNANIVSSVAKIFPLFFFLVAALVCMTTMTRMVDEQRSQIGALRALGYSNRSIRRKYLIYSGSASFLGSIAGFFVGCQVFPIAIWNAYTMMYNFSSEINILHNWILGILATLVAMACAMGATWISCSSEFKEVAAELIRPKSPPAGKKILLEKFTLLWERLGFMHKVSLRNAFRYKKRFFMMLLGICGCTALLVAGLGIRSSISDVANNQYDEFNQYDYQLAFIQKMDNKDQEEFVKTVDKKIGNYGDIVFLHSGSVSINLDTGTKNVTLNVVDGDKISKFVNLKYDGEAINYPGDGEVAVCRKMQDQFGVNIGDVITIKEGYYEMTAKVSAVYDNYIQETMYMSTETYKAGMNRAPEIRTALVKAVDGTSVKKIRTQSTAMAQEDCVAVASVSADIRETVETMMKSMNAIVYVVILCAGLLAFIVLYNLTNINIMERIREIATIRVLGFYRRETSQYVFRENLILTFISAVVGLPVGKVLLGFVIKNIKIDTMFFMPKLVPLDYLIAFVVTFVFTFIVNLTLKPRINSVSMTESLKTVE